MRRAWCINMLLGVFAQFEGELSAAVYDFSVTRSRAQRLYINWDAVGDDMDAVDDWNVVIQDGMGSIVGQVNPSKSPSKRTRTIQKLKPRHTYRITIRAVSGNREGPSSTYEATTSPRPVENARVSDITQRSVQVEWDSPREEGASQYQITDVDTDEMWNTYAEILTLEMDPGQSRNLNIQAYTEAGSNVALSKPVYVTATAIPPRPENVRLSGEKVTDYLSADGTVSWINPLEGEWDAVKIEYSPNDPPAKDKSPMFVSKAFLGDNNSIQINGLHQNTVYTFSVRFVRNNVEGPAETHTWNILDASGHVAPSALTCKVPLYLKPENLIVKRDIFAGDGGAMDVSWEHPRGKQPENGYRLVFAPFKDITQQKPWYEDLDQNTNTFSLTGHKYDAIDEYTVSVIARHDEQLDDPTSPDFIASHFTGVYKKLMGPNGERRVATDSCCGSQRINSMEQSCCGGTLMEDIDGLLCCVDMPYSPITHKCCGSHGPVEIFEAC